MELPEAGPVADRVDKADVVDRVDAVERADVANQDSY
jgi:hypothetical protein